MRDINVIPDQELGQFAFGVLAALRTYISIDGQTEEVFELAGDRYTRKAQLGAIRSELRDLLER